MRVWINEDGLNGGLKQHLIYEGDEIVEDRATADLSIPDPVEIPVPVLMGAHIRPSREAATHFVSRFFNGQSYEPQCFIGLPLVGMMDGEMGKDCPTGCATRGIEAELYGGWFENEVLLGHFRASGYVGFVSFRFAAGQLKSVQTGVPCYGLYSLLEGVRGGISKFYTEPSRLYESWAVALLVSRYPFPFAMEAEKVPVEGLNLEIEKHFWTFKAEKFRHVTTTTSTVVGVATAWHMEHLWRCCEWVLQTARAIEVPLKQHRLDLQKVFQSQWGDLKDLQLV